jgi:hypothetical protein
MPESDSEASGDVQEYELVMSDSLRLVEYEWVSDKTWLATFESDITQTVYVADRGLDVPSNGYVVYPEPEERKVSREGQTTIRFTVEDSPEILVSDGTTTVGFQGTQELTVFPNGDYTRSSLLIGGGVSVLMMVIFAVIFAYSQRNHKRVV